MTDLIEKLRYLGDPASMEAAAEIIRLTEALNVAEDKLRLESALTDGAHRRAREAEEARRAERAAVVRECVYRATNACLVPPDGGSPTPEEVAVCDEAARRILALATDADNAALDKLLREARKVKPLEWVDVVGQSMTHVLGLSYEAYETRPDEWNVVRRAPDHARLKTGVSREAAKATAQADYEARILAALEAPQ